MTLLLVTHDPVVAEAAERVVRIRDGRITSDEEPLAVAANDLADATALATRMVREDPQRATPRTP